MWGDQTAQRGNPKSNPAQLTRATGWAGASRGVNPQSCWTLWATAVQQREKSSKGTLILSFKSRLSKPFPTYLQQWDAVLDRSPSRLLTGRELYLYLMIRRTSKRKWKNLIGNHQSLCWALIPVRSWTHTLPLFMGLLLMHNFSASLVQSNSIKILQSKSNK